MDAAAERGVSKKLNRNSAETERNFTVLGLVGGALDMRARKPELAA